MIDFSGDKEIHKIDAIRYNNFISDNTAEHFLNLFLTRNQYRVDNLLETQGSQGKPYLLVVESFYLNLTTSQNLLFNSSTITNV